MKAIFKKKDSKSSSNNADSGKSSFRPPATNERINSYSHKSPKLVNDKFYSSAMSRSIPDIAIPDPPDPKTKPAAYLRSIHAVRQRTNLVLEEAKVNALHHFDVDMSKFRDTADYVVSIIKVSATYSSLTPISPQLIPSSEISRESIRQYHPMVVGNILKWEEGHA